MSSVVDTVAEHLTAAGVVGAWTLFRGYEPPDPDKTISIIEYAGPPPDTTFVADYPNFQVRVRVSEDEYVTGRDKAGEVLEALHAQAVTGTSVSPNESLVYVIAEQQPYPVDRDSRARLIFGFNCRSMRT